MEESGLVYKPVEFSVAEIKNAMESFKNGKAAGHTGITAEHFKWLDIEGIEWLTMLMNEIIEEETVLVSWTRNYMTMIYKDKEDPLQFKNFRGIKLLKVRPKVLEVMHKRLRKVVSIGNAQFGFQLKKGNNRCNVYFEASARKVLEKREKLFVTFLHLEKAYDRIPREVVY